MTIYSESIIVLEQGRPTFFSRGPNLLFEKFGEPKFIVYRLFCQNVGEDKKKKGLKGLRSDLISVFCQNVGEDQKKKVFAQILSVFSAKK